MKATILFLALSLTALVSFANTDPNEDDAKVQLRSQVKELLEEPSVEFNGDLIASKIIFTINPSGEIVVLDVKCTDLNVAQFIKSRLNYVKTNAPATNYGKTYNLVYKIKNNELILG